MPRSFDDVTRWETERLEVPADWLQGRTAYGGLQAAAGLRAMEALVPADRPLRSVSTCFVGPAVGELRARAEVLRSGRSVTHARCDLIAGDEVVCTLSAAYGVPRASIVERRPTVALGDPADAMELPFLKGIVPDFTQHMDLRWVEGGFPFSGTKQDAHKGWCRHRTEPGPAAAAILGLLDAWPSPALQQLRGPAPASSVTWSALFVKLPERVTRDDWFWLEAQVVGAHGDGFVTMRGELYDAEGDLVAHLEQLVAVYG